MAASGKAKKVLEGANVLKVKGATAPEATQGAAILHYLASDGGSGQESRAEALVLERKLEAAATSEDPARRELLMQSLAAFVNRTT